MGKIWDKRSMQTHDPIDVRRMTEIHSSASVYVTSLFKGDEFYMRVHIKLVYVSLFYSESSRETASDRKSHEEREREKKAAVKEIWGNINHGPIGPMRLQRNNVMGILQSHMMDGYI